MTGLSWLFFSESEIQPNQCSSVQKTHTAVFAYLHDIFPVFSPSVQVGVKTASV